jgi:hypothetical protein
MQLLLKFLGEKLIKLLIFTLLDLFAIFTKAMISKEHVLETKNIKPPLKSSGFIIHNKYYKLDTTERDLTYLYNVHELLIPLENALLNFCHQNRFQKR